MKITLNLASTVITIDFHGQTKDVASVYQQLFKEFISEEQAGAFVEVSFLPDSINRRLFDARSQYPTPETPVLCHVPKQEVFEWLSEIGEIPGSASFSKDTICALFLNGLLFYRPDTSRGHLYILRDGLGNFRSLYFLFWLYFAQVLGETGGCFLHAAALAKDERGSLFIGDSGAGKSTLSFLCSDYQIFSDDGPIIVSQNGGYCVYPSPFHQQDSLNGLEDKEFASGVPIVRLCFLVKDDATFIEKIPKKEAFFMIMTRHIHFFDHLSISAKRKLFDLFWGACNNIIPYYFHFSKGRNVCSYLTQFNGG